MRAQEIGYLTDPYKGKKVQVVKYQDTDDIIDLVMKAHSMPENQRSYDRVAERFWTGDAKGTAQNLYNFLAENIKYKIEPDKDQTIRSPGATLSLGHGDCKHYATFIVGVLDALRRKGYDLHPYYRFASYKITDRTPGHVFAVLKQPGEPEIWIDPVPNVGGFNVHRMYFFHQDKKPPRMALSYVSGVPQYPIYGVGKKPKHKAAKAHKPKKKGGFLKKVTSAVKKGSLALPRNSFLTLLQLNTFHMATKMWLGMKKNPQLEGKLKNLWEKLGGNWKTFMINVRKGVGTWNKLHKSKKISLSGPALHEYTWYGVYDHPVNGIGVVQFAAAAAVLAAAAPIIKAFSGIFKSLGISTKKTDESTDDAVEEVNAQAEEQKEGGDTPRTDAARSAMDEAGIPVKDVPVQHSTDSDGNTKMLIPSEVPAGGSDEGGSAPPPGAPGGSPSVGIDDTLSQVKDKFNQGWEWVKAHKTPIIATGVGLVILHYAPAIIGAAKGRRTTKRRR